MREAGVKGGPGYFVSSVNVPLRAVAREARHLPHALCFQGKGWKVETPGHLDPLTCLFLDVISSPPCPFGGTQHRVSGLGSLKTDTFPPAPSNPTPPHKELDS